MIYLALAYDAPKYSMRISPPPLAYLILLCLERIVPNLWPIYNVLSSQALACIHCYLTWRICYDPPMVWHDKEKRIK